MLLTGLLNYRSFTGQLFVPTAHSSPGPPTSVLSENKCFTDLPTGQSDGGYSSTKGPSSQVTLLGVKLTKTYRTKCAGEPLCGLTTDESSSSHSRLCHQTNQRGLLDSWGSQLSRVRHLPRCTLAPPHRAPAHSWSGTCAGFAGGHLLCPLD